MIFHGANGLVILRICAVAHLRGNTVSELQHQIAIAVCPFPKMSSALGGPGLGPC